MRTVRLRRARSWERLFSRSTKELADTSTAPRPAFAFDRGGDEMLTPSGMSAWVAHGSAPEGRELPVDEALS